MSSDDYAGLGALLHLSRVRALGRVRHGMRSLRSPKRLALVLLGLTLVGFFVAASMQGDRGANPAFRDGRSDLMISLMLTFFLATTALAAVANGVMAFSPAEVQFLFPGPVGRKALVASQLISTAAKALSGAIIFSLVLNPGDSSAWRVIAGYFLVFCTLGLLGVAVDLRHMQLLPAQRKRRALLLGIGAALILAGVVAATLAEDGKPSLQMLRHALWPGRLFAGILVASETSVALMHLGGTLALALVLGALCLTGDHAVRAGALATSDRVRVMLERMGKGGPIPETVKERTSGKLLPMLPRWGGAGVHVWRQLSALRRRRKSFILMLFVVLIAVTTSALAGSRPRPEVGAMVAIVMLAIMGPFYVQCDFRADHDALAWLRSLPTSATTLAAGQLLASTFVLTALQLLLGGWGVFVAEPSHLPIWAFALLALPALNMVVLAVENAAWLIYPVRLDYSKGPPGALEIIRLYGVFIAKAVVLVVVLGMAVLPGAGVGWATGMVPAGLATGFVALHLEVALLVVIVGRLFRWVDPSRDLSAD